MTTRLKSRLLRGNSALCLTLLSVVIILSVGCSENRDPHTPDGALRRFALILAEPGQPQLKTSLSASTFQTLRDILALTKRVESELQRFPTEAAQAWARGEALGETLGRVAQLPDADAVLRHVMRERLTWVATQSADEVEQGLSALRTISGSLKEGQVTLLTRAGQKVPMRLEQLNGESRWMVSVFERPLLTYVKALEASLAKMDTNRAEWRRRMRLELELPSAPAPGKR